MQVCKNCGAYIRYIARTNNTSVTVNADEVTIYTLNGREVRGFTPHACKPKEKNDREEK